MTDSNTTSNDDMQVIKRNGEVVEMSFDKILYRIKIIGKECNIQNFNYSALAMKVIDQLFDKIETSKIDELLAEQCASSISDNIHFSTFASRILISSHQKNTLASFTKTMEKLYNKYDMHSNHTPIISKSVMDIASKYENEIDSIIDHRRDYKIDYFGFKTLERAYLFRINNQIVERIQHMWMRVSIGIHGDNFDLIRETYDLMSNKFFTHATPTLFNAGTNKPQLSSCYLIAMEDDSIDGIFNTLKDCASISKYSGGIGLHISNVRAKNSLIRGTNGKTDGLVPMLRVFNNMARYVNQSGKRNGSVAIYLEPWHADIVDFLELRKNHGDEEVKARDLFYALWVSDLFMERVKTNAEWSLFCPDECPGLSDTYGDEFNKLYTTYEEKGLYREKISARSLWFKVLDAQMETGTPYLLYKDSANKKSNQNNIGIIKSSNLCCEIIEYSDKNETAVCNLASIALPNFVKPDMTFDYDHLHYVTKVVTRNLNKVIDVNFYPTDKTLLSNKRHRPIGIGVQGLADVFMLMNIPFYGDDAKSINKQIFETIYHASLEMSNEIATERYLKIRTNFPKNDESEIYNIVPSDPGSSFFDNLMQTFDLHKDEIINFMFNYETLPTYCGSYSSFKNSPAHNKQLQFDLWGVQPSDRYDWEVLKNKIECYGLRNSLLVAPMPTASTSQILGYNECFEPFTSNIYTRRTLAGEFVMVNKYLMRELTDLGLWNNEIKNNIIANKGSVQHLTMLPQHILNKYKIVWEIPMKHIIDMSADRGAFICQSQSLNLWLEDPSYNTLTSMHFYSWSKGLKTGIYYLRRKGKHQAQQFTIEPEKSSDVSHEQDEICEMCSG